LHGPLVRLLHPGFQFDGVALIDDQRTPQRQPALARLRARQDLRLDAAPPVALGTARGRQCRDLREEIGRASCRERV
jgi:hypothetical protein